MIFLRYARDIVTTRSVLSWNTDTDMDWTGPDYPCPCPRFFYIRDFLSALMLATSLVNSGQKISNIGPCPNCPADTASGTTQIGKKI